MGEVLDTNNRRRYAALVHLTILNSHINTDLEKQDTSHQFIVTFYGHHVRLFLYSHPLQASLSTHVGGSLIDNEALWITYTSAVEMLKAATHPSMSPLLSFVPDSMHVMTAYAAVFLIKVRQLTSVLPIFPLPKTIVLIFPSVFNSFFFLSTKRLDKKSSHQSWKRSERLHESLTCKLLQLPLVVPCRPSFSIIACGSTRTLVVIVP